jgi:hypothetical protein
MGIQRYTLPSGAVRYRARVKSHGREVAARVFKRRADAVAWEQDQRRRLRLGEWIDPRRGQVPLSVMAADWLRSRGSVKHRTRESDESAWRNYIRPRFGNWPVASITAAEVSSWADSLVARGLASTAVGSDCYSRGYPHARESASLADITYQRAWRFLRTSKRQSTRGLK